MENSQIAGAVPSKPGILFVGSKVVHPDKLDPLDFNDWYENTHIQEVQSTGGISGSQRYESLSFHKQYRDSSAKTNIPNSGFDFDFITVYNMPDLAFRESKAFRSLDGQSKPNEELLEKLFKHSSFITRFAEETESSGASGSNGSAAFAITVASNSEDPSPSIVASLSKLAEYRGTRTFKIHENSLLDRFERDYMHEPTILALLEFDSIPEASALSKEIEAAKGLEVGLWKLRRNYAGTERTPAGWKPK